MKQFKLNKREIQKLLTLINNAEDRSATESYLQGLMDSNPDKRRLHAILRGMLNIGETVLIKELVCHLFD
jgi:hypothetical protein